MKPILACALALSLTAPTLCLAAPMDDGIMTVKVQNQDLDLNRTRDATRMLGRLSDAALQACGGSTFSLPDYRQAIEHQACYKAGLGQAVATLNAPLVTKVYQGQPTD